MNYGLEFTADTGFKFIIPQHQGFVFHKYVDISITSNKGYVTHVIEGVPAGGKCMIFARHIGGPDSDFVPHIALNDLGNRFSIELIWPHYPSNDYIPGTYRIYIFTTYEVNPAGPYGLQVFNENGTLTYGTNTKPLKVYEGLYNVGVNVDVGFTAAVAPVLLGVVPERFQGPTGFWTLIGNANLVARGTSIINRRTFIRVVPAEIYPTGVANRSYLYINASDYD